MLHALVHLENTERQQAGVQLSPRGQRKATEGRTWQWRRLEHQGMSPCPLPPSCFEYSKSTRGTCVLLNFFFRNFESLVIINLKNGGSEEYLCKSSCPLALSTPADLVSNMSNGF